MYRGEVETVGVTETNCVLDNSKIVMYCRQMLVPTKIWDLMTS